MLRGDKPLAEEGWHLFVEKITTVVSLLYLYHQEFLIIQRNMRFDIWVLGVDR